MFVNGLNTFRMLGNEKNIYLNDFHGNNILHILNLEKQQRNNVQMKYVVIFVFQVQYSR